MINLKITEEHIKKGIRLQARFCPAALALKELFPINEISVFYDIYIDERHIRTPDKLFKWIESYDRGEEVDPIYIELPNF